MTTIITTAHHILVGKNPTEVIHPNISDLPGLSLLVVHAVDSDAIMKMWEIRRNGQF